MTTSVSLRQEIVRDKRKHFLRAENYFFIREALQQNLRERVQCPDTRCDAPNRWQPRPRISGRQGQIDGMVGWANARAASPRRCRRKSRFDRTTHLICTVSSSVVARLSQQEEQRPSRVHRTLPRAFIDSRCSMIPSSKKKRTPRSRHIPLACFLTVASENLRINTAAKYGGSIGVPHRTGQVCLSDFQGIVGTSSRPMEGSIRQRGAPYRQANAMLLGTHIAERPAFRAAID